jgi:hypothetical protein
VSFWHFPKHSKLDILSADHFNHNELIERALADPDTQSEWVEEDKYLFYGPSMPDGGEGLLILVGKNPVLRVGIRIFNVLLAFINTVSNK